ncbi:MAG: hypothetical protein M0D54_11845 [Hyphomonadaceae bacterium JAD_PAG50586_4]|nr:MAG: hypothetical protein M0D54_11845 [Hyphomonadaceae bacterium JAD_PAG50586_4]
MKGPILVALCGVLGGIGLGYLTTPGPRAEAVAGFEEPLIVHGRGEAAEARARLVALGLNPAPVLETGPPPPDVALLFRRDLTAIESQSGGLVVWIVDFTQAHQRRALRVGDVYQDRWRVARITPQAVELRRQREVRTIGVFASSGIEP